MRLRRIGACAGILLIASCSTDTVTPESSPAFASASTAAENDGPVSAALARINDSLATLGMNFAIHRAEFVLAPNAPLSAGQTVFANDRTKRLTSRWVPGDDRREADGNRITYMNFDPLMGATAAGNVESAIDASFATWDGMKCTDLAIVKRPWNLGNASAIVSGIAPPVSVFSADVFTLGFVPGSLLDAVLGAGASNNVLGVTFTFIFGTNTPAGFIPSDIDGDGNTDTAIKEVWYNNAFSWTLSGLGSNIDVESVALHENGHALELGHFGKIFRTTANGNLQVGTRAVMNAAILGTLRTPLGTDNAAYCGNFATWPG
jgi:hypothetical protein